MNRNRTPLASAHASRSGASARVSRSATALILIGLSPACCAASIPLSTAGRRSRRVTAAKCSRSIVSSDTLIRVSPASTSCGALRSRPIPLVVIDTGRPGTAVVVWRTISTRSGRVSGSPPVKRTSRTPRSWTAMVTRRAISSGVSNSPRGTMGRPSAGMQYVQRSEQALVIDTRRSRAMRPNLSTRNGVSGRPTVERARWRTVGMPSATGHMVTDFFSMLAGGARSPGGASCSTVWSAQWPVFTPGTHHLQSWASSAQDQAISERAPAISSVVYSQRRRKGRCMSFTTRGFAGRRRGPDEMFLLLRSFLTFRPLEKNFFKAKLV